MRIRFFGRLADALGGEVELPVAGSCTLAELRDRLASDYPQAARALDSRTRACIADRFVTDDHVVRPGESVEFIPPVSGG